MTVIFTCGHKAEDEEEGFVISTKAYSRKSERAVEYRTVCSNCYRVFEEEDRILFSESEVIKWLEGE
jgi:hypothetical protein